MRLANPLLPKVDHDKRKKITPQNIVEIKAMVAAGNTRKKIAKEFGVRASTIRYHINEKYRQYRIQVATVAIQKKLNNPKTRVEQRKKQNIHNKTHYVRLMEIPGNRKKWQNYHRERHHQHKEIE